MYRRGRSRRAKGLRRNVRVEASGPHTLREIYSAYYTSRPLLLLPPDMDKREFAFQPWGSTSYVRHLSFGSEDELYNYLAEHTPLHAYYSLALYEYPDAPNMDDKGFIRADLMFDIDADHFEGCSSPLLPDRCLEEASEAAWRLIRIIERDLGAKRWSIYYTGNRGFHITASCEGCETLGREERRAIAYYVSGHDIDITRLFPLEPGHDPAVPTPNDPGWRGWIGLLLAEKFGGALRKTRRLREVLGPRTRFKLEAMIDEIRVPIDLQVTQDLSRLLRIPGSLNGKTGLRVTPVDDPRRFRPERRLSPLRGESKIESLSDVDVDSFLGEPLSLRAGKTYWVPAAVGVALASKGLARILEVIADVELDPGWRTL
jgi:DNA primase small subunit